MRASRPPIAAGPGRVTVWSMPKITLVTNDVDDVALWYLDGAYVGHDDQFSPEEVAVAGATVSIELEKVEVPPGWFDQAWPETWPPAAGA